MNPFPAARFLLSVASVAQFPPDDGAEVAFAGRSNAGKSTAINAIVRHAGLARASKTPGRTQLLNYFALESERRAGSGGAQRIVDLPGYGYADVPEAERRKWAPLLAALAARRALIGLMLVVDARRGLAAGDQALIAWAVQPFARRIHVLLAKSDKLTPHEGRQALATAERELEARATVQLFSATAGTGVPEAQRLLQRWLQEPGSSVSKNKIPGDSVAGITGAD
jgi:GTP-binding protein